MCSERLLVNLQAHRPIELCAMLVQEELALMREEPCLDPVQDQQEGGLGLQHRFVAGVSCFSFNLIPKKNKIMSEIHHPHVPGFQSDLQHSMTRFFAELEPDATDCRWRSNFGFNTHGHLCDHALPHAELIHSEETHLNKMGDQMTWEEELDRDENKPTTAAGVRRDGFVRVEMETFRRLPKSRFILFTVRTYELQYKCQLCFF